MNWRNNTDEWDEGYYEDRPKKNKKLPKMKDFEKLMENKKKFKK